MLLQQGQVDDINNNGQTALAVACNDQFVDGVKLLLAYKPNLKMRDDKGDVAFIAVVAAKLDCQVKREKISLNVLNKSGNLVLQIAINPKNTGKKYK